MPTIRFTSPVSRLESVAPKAPYDLTNARLESLGEVRALTDGQSVSAPVVGGKPWRFWDGEVIDPYPADSIGGRLCMSDPKTGEFRVYPEDYASAGYDVAVPHVQSAGVESQDRAPFDASGGFSNVRGISEGAAVSYIFVPLNGRDEAGPWFYMPVNARGSDPWSALGSLTGEGSTFQGDLPDAAWVPTIEIETGPETEYVEVYRTAERFLNRRPNASTPEARESWRRLEEGGSDNVYHYLDRISTEGGQTTFTDDTFIPSYEAFKAEEDMAVYTETGEFIGLSTIDRSINVHAQGREYTHALETGSGPSSKNFSKVSLADATTPRTGSYTAMHNDGGVFYNAGATWPTKTPQACLHLAHGGDGGLGLPSIRVAAQFEYQTDRGTFYGPLQDFGDTTKLEIPWEGEQAVMLYVMDGGNWKLHERITPNQVGRYVGEGGTLVSSDGTKTSAASHLTFDYEAWEFRRDEMGEDPSDDLGGAPKEPSDYVTERGVAFLSDQNRPIEVTYDQFSVPGRETIIAIESARQAEEEAIRSYRFYVFTDGAILYGRREDRGVLLEPVSSTVGLRAWNEATRETGFDPERFRSEADYNPTRVVEQTRVGLAFAGTDGRVYHLTGRQMQDLTRGVPDLFTEIRDIGYDEREDEIYLLDENRIWIYSFEQSGWVGSYAFEETVANVGYVPQWNAMLARFETGERRILTRGGGVLDAEVQTQPLQGIQHIDQILCDYSPVGGRAKIEHAVDSLGTSLEHDLPKGHPVYPRLRGWNHRLTIKEFDVFRHLSYESESP